MLKVGDAERKCASLAAEVAKLKEDFDRQQNVFFSSLESATSQVREPLRLRTF